LPWGGIDIGAKHTVYLLYLFRGVSKPGAILACSEIAAFVPAAYLRRSTGVMAISYIFTGLKLGILLVEAASGTILTSSQLPFSSLTCSEAMSTMVHLKEISIDSLARRCARETELFYRKQKGDDRFCFELFQRAIVNGTEQAWHYLYGQYSPLVSGWVREHKVFASCDEEVQYFVNGAFARFGRTCTREKFAAFAGLKQLLTYLQACVHSEIIDYYRRLRSEPLSASPSDVEVLSSRRSDTGQTQLEMVERREAFWACVKRFLNSEQEEIVLVCFFIWDLKPREIYGIYPGKFKDVEEVHAVKDNLVRRLRRNTDLAACFAAYD
jgi:hypothetical protein